MIRSVGRTLTTLYGGTDALMGRIGGEDFEIFPTYPTIEARDDPIETSRSVNAAMTVPGLSRAVTASLGVADASPDRGAIETSIAADRALYLTKAAGRNRIVCEDDRRNLGSGMRSIRAAESAEDPGPLRLTCGQNMSACRPASPP